MKSRILILLILLCVCLFLNARSVFGQNTTGSITGRLTDPTGAVIAGAKITVRNLGTGEIRTLTTDASGDFTATLLLPGHYSVTAEHTGVERQLGPKTIPNLDYVGNKATHLNIRTELNQPTPCNATSGCNPDSSANQSAAGKQSRRPYPNHGLMAYEGWKLARIRVISVPPDHSPSVLIIPDRCRRKDHRPLPLISPHLITPRS